MGVPVLQTSKWLILRFAWARAAAVQ